MKCQRIGCNNHAIGAHKFVKAYVTDNRPGKPKNIKRDENGDPIYIGGNPENPEYTNDRVELWCMECAGVFKPEEFRLIYTTEGGRMKMKRVALEDELKTTGQIKVDADTIAPIEKPKVAKKIAKKEKASASDNTNIQSA